MVWIVLSGVVAIIFGSAKVWIVIKDQGRTDCSHATLRGYRTDMPNDALGPIGHVIEDGSDLSHAGDDMSDQSGSRSSDRKSGAV